MNIYGCLIFVDLFVLGYRAQSACPPGTYLSSFGCADVPEITKVSPSYGPRRGGTEVYLTFKEVTRNYPKVIFLNGLARELQATSHTTTYVFETPGVPLIGLFMGGVQLTDGSKFNFTFPFEYRQDPVILGVDNPYMIVSGGTILEVRGQHLTSVANPFLLLHVLVSGRWYPLNSRCSVINSQSMECFTSSLEGIITFPFLSRPPPPSTTTESYANHPWMLWYSNGTNDLWRNETGLFVFTLGDAQGNRQFLQLVKIPGSRGLPTTPSVPIFPPINGVRSPTPLPQPTSLPTSIPAAQTTDSSIVTSDNSEPSVNSVGATGFTSDLNPSHPLVPLAPAPPTRVVNNVPDVTTSEAITAPPVTTDRRPLNVVTVAPTLAPTAEKATPATSPAPSTTTSSSTTTTTMLTTPLVPVSTTTTTAITKSATTQQTTTTTTAATTTTATSTTTTPKPSTSTLPEPPPPPPPTTTVPTTPAPVFPPDDFRTMVPHVRVNRTVQVITSRPSVRRIVKTVTTHTKVIFTRTYTNRTHKVITNNTGRFVYNRQGVLLNYVPAETDDDDAPPSGGGRKKRQVARSSVTDAVVFAGFWLDGVKEFQNVTRIKVFENPRLTKFPGKSNVMEFNQEMVFIEITGVDLNRGAGVKDYYVSVGSASCNITLLATNKLLCIPPADRPHPGIHGHGPDQSVRVTISVGRNGLSYFIGYLKYVIVPSKKPTLSTTEIIVLVVVSQAFIWISVLMFWCICRKRKIDKREERRRRDEMDNLDPYDTSYMQGKVTESRYTINIAGVNGASSSDSGNTLSTLLPRDSMMHEPYHSASDFQGDVLSALSGGARTEINKCRIESDRMSLLECIGKGFYGRVYKGVLVDVQRENPMLVAVKTIQDDLISEKELNSFIQEALLMRGFSHPNILTLLGVVIQSYKPFIVMEYMDLGNLRSYVSMNKHDLSEVDLIRFALEVSKALEYLSGRNFIHGDIALRNCLINSSGAIKLGDFGLSRDLFEHDYYKQSDKHRPLPVRWMSTEALTQGKFSTKSDIWAYGITIWELFTFGGTPFPDVDNYDVRGYVTKGARPERPAAADHDIYNLMKSCWLDKPSSRPSFGSIVQILEKLYRSMNRYVLEPGSKSHGDGYLHPVAMTTFSRDGPGGGGGGHRVSYNC